MATKSSAVLEDAVYRIPIAELTSGGPLFEWTIPSPSTAKPERITQFDLDNCQIALVPFRDGQDRAGESRRRAGRMGRLLLLPLTWRQFVTRVRETIGRSDSLEENEIVRFGRVSMDFLSMEVRRADCKPDCDAVQGP